MLFSVVHFGLTNRAISIFQKASKNYNVIVVDWSAGCEHQFQYFHSVSNTRIVGAIVANWLRQMTDRHQYSLENVHCIGHSLGAHTCGFIGKRIPLVRITGLCLEKVIRKVDNYSPETNTSSQKSIDDAFLDIKKIGSR